jgi:hypothetical protein
MLFTKNQDFFLQISPAWVPDSQFLEISDSGFESTATYVSEKHLMF